MQKREHIVDIEEDWIHLGQAENGYAINSYFVDHPEMVLGTLEEQSTQYGVECTVKAYKDRDLSDLLSEAITHVYGHYEPVIQQKDEKNKIKRTRFCQLIQQCVTIHMHWWMEQFIIVKTQSCVK